MRHPSFHGLEALEVGGNDAHGEQDFAIDDLVLAVPFSSTHSRSMPNACTSVRSCAHTLAVYSLGVANNVHVAGGEVLGVLLLDELGGDVAGYELGVVLDPRDVSLLQLVVADAVAVVAHVHPIVALAPPELERCRRAPECFDDDANSSIGCCARPTESGRSGRRSRPCVCRSVR